MSRVVGRRIIFRDVVGSTMDEVAALAAAGEAEGIVVVAEQQTAGRGRADRIWETPHGSAVLASILLRPLVPPERLGLLSLVAGVAVAEVIEQATGVVPALKWPNDVWIDGRKVAGILVTSRLDQSGGITAILGIGLNVNTTPAELAPGATSLAVATGRPHERAVLLAMLLDRLDRAYATFVEVRGCPDLSGWSRRAALVGDLVTVTDGERTRAGTLLGIDHTGALLLAEPDGTTARIVAGELTRGPALIPVCSRQSAVSSQQ